jgi:hypothetical protein
VGFLRCIVLSRLRSGAHGYGAREARKASLTQYSMPWQRLDNEPSTWHHILRLLTRERNPLKPTVILHRSCCVSGYGYDPRHGLYCDLGCTEG